MKKLIYTIMLLIFCQKALAGEIPGEVLNRIKAKVSAKYPDSYSLQLTLVESDVKAYKFIQAYKPEGVPEKVLKRIKSKIADRYPNSYNLQKILIVSDVKAYLELTK